MQLLNKEDKLQRFELCTMNQPEVYMTPVH